MYNGTNGEAYVVTRQVRVRTIRDGTKTLESVTSKSVEWLWLTMSDKWISYLGISSVTSRQIRGSAVFIDIEVSALFLLNGKVLYP